jgi:hypothetical protein
MIEVMVYDSAESFVAIYTCIFEDDPHALSADSHAKGIFV